MGEPEVEQEEEQRFKIDDDDKSCWALKKIKAMKEEIEEKEDLAESQIYQVERWLEKEKEKRQEKIEYLEGLLQEYALELKEEKPDLKTHSLPFGELKFRKQRPKWKYDSNKLVKSAEDILPDAVKTKKKVNKKELKKMIKDDNSPFQIIEEDGRVVNTETGEVLEGVTVKERGEKFKVKVE